MPCTCKPLLAAALATLALFPLAASAQTAQPQHPRRNVIIFVADGLRRGSVTPEDTPTLYRIRTQGTDFRDSHAVFPTFTTSNASAIATGHGLGDTGDYGNFLYPGTFLTKPDPTPAAGILVPFLENDDILADMNARYHGNYLHEPTLLDSARAAGYNVASVGKLGPTAIQQNQSVAWDPQGFIPGVLNHGAIILDDSTGKPNGVFLPPGLADAILAAHLVPDAPTRANGYNDTSQGNNNNAGTATDPGTLLPNSVQQQWFADVSTKVLLPRFASEAESKSDPKPFLFLFWSRDPDGTQHNEGDSLQRLSPGINGDTTTLALRNADHNLAQLFDWLNAHPAIQANTDILVTSDHGFATITRREIDAAGTLTAEPSAYLTYEPLAKDKPEPPGTLPQGFLAIDLAIRGHLRLYDAGERAASGPSVYNEVTLNGDKAHYPSGTGSALLASPDHGNGIIHNLDGSDAQLIVAANGGTDLIYAPTKDPAIVRSTLALLTQLDYVGSLFVDDTYCPTPASCPGALPMSSVGMVGASPVTRPAIVVAFKTFYTTPGNLQTGVVFSDYPLQEGEGMHGSLSRGQTWNNMAALGPDFKRSFVDPDPAGNIDIVPTLAHILGLALPANGHLTGRILSEALTSTSSQFTSQTPSSEPANAGGFPVKTLVSAPTGEGLATILEYEEHNGVRYYDTACLIPIPKDATSPHCPQ